MERIPAGFELQKVHEVPLDVRAAYLSKWYWLKQRLASLDAGEILMITCPDRKKASTAAKVATEYYRHNRDVLKCRTFSREVENGVQVYIEVYNKNAQR